MDNWTAPKYTFIQHKIVLSGSQKFTRCIPLSKREAKIRNHAGSFVFDKFTFNTSKSWWQIWWRVNQAFKYIYITFEVNSAMRRCFFFFFSPGWSKQVPPLHNKLLNWSHYKTFSWREFSIMWRVFSQKNMLLCHMWGNKYGLLVKTIKKFIKSPIRPAGRVLTFDNRDLTKPRRRRQRERQKKQ